MGAILLTDKCNSALVMNDENLKSTYSLLSLNTKFCCIWNRLAIIWRWSFEDPYFGCLGGRELPQRKDHPWRPSLSRYKLLLYMPPTVWLEFQWPPKLDASFWGVRVDVGVEMIWYGVNRNFNFHTHTTPPIRTSDSLTQWFCVCYKFSLHYPIILLRI